MRQLKAGLVYSLFIIGLILLYKFVNKNSLMAVINRSLPEREAGLLAGMVVGEKQSMSTEFYELLKMSGLVHLVIVSGSNVMLLSRGLIENLAGYLGRKKTIIIVLILVWSYAAMVGWELPVVRAVLMVSVYYWAQILGKKFNVGRALILVISMMLLADWQMIKEAGFWLSVLAFTAIVSTGVIASGAKQSPAKGGQAWRSPRPDDTSGLAMTLANDFWLTIWVSIWITPVLAMVFGKISLISPLTNVAVLFLVETITLVGAVGSVAGVFWMAAGRAILWAIYPLLKYFVWVVEYFGSWKWTNVAIRFNWWLLIGWYMVLGWFLITRRATTRVARTVGAGLVPARKDGLK